MPTSVVSVILRWKSSVCAPAFGYGNRHDMRNAFTLNINILVLHYRYYGESAWCLAWENACSRPMLSHLLLSDSYLIHVDDAFSCVSFHSCVPYVFYWKVAYENFIFWTLAQRIYVILVSMDTEYSVLSHINTANESEHQKIYWWECYFMLFDQAKVESLRFVWVVDSDTFKFQRIGHFFFIILIMILGVNFPYMVGACVARDISR